VWFKAKRSDSFVYCGLNMLMISKSLSQLILPPSGLILWAVLGLVFWKKAWGRWLVALVLLLFWLLSTEPVRDLLLNPLEHQYSPFHIESVAGKQAAIVVLGGGVQEKSLDYQGEDTLSRFAMMRVIYAAKIAEQTPFPVYATGGTPLSEVAEAEGSVMRRWLIWFGVDMTRIHAENQSNTTWENATLTQALLAKKHIKTVILVTSAWHMPRAVWCFEAQGLTVITAPTDYFTEQEAYDLRSFLPHWSVFFESGQALQEHLGLLWYKLKFGSRSL